MEANERLHRLVSFVATASKSWKYPRMTKLMEELCGNMLCTSIVVLLFFCSHTLSTYLMSLHYRYCNEPNTVTQFCQRGRRHPFASTGVNSWESLSLRPFAVCSLELGWSASPKFQRLKRGPKAFGHSHRRDKRKYVCSKGSWFSS